MNLNTELQFDSEQSTVRHDLYDKGRADRRRNPLPSDEFSKISGFSNLHTLYFIFDNAYAILTDQLANHAYSNKM